MESVRGGFLPGLELVCLVSVVSAIPVAIPNVILDDACAVIACEMPWSAGYCLFGSALDAKPGHLFLTVFCVIDFPLTELIATDLLEV